MGGGSDVGHERRERGADLALEWLLAEWVVAWRASDQSQEAL